MGCCFSSPLRTAAPTPISSTSQNQVAADSSRANINNPHSTQSFLSASASESVTNTPRASHSRHERPQVGVDAPRGRAGSGGDRKDSRPNKPLVAMDRGRRRCKGPPLSEGAAAVAAASSSPSPVALSSSSPSALGPRLTRARLERERNAFWETRVTGHPEMWGAVRLAAELVRGGDVASAQGVLDAAGATCPTGEIWRGVFDEWGAEYRVAEWVVAEPAGVVEEVEEDGEAAGGQSAPGSVGTEEKGKGKMGEVVKVKARLSDRGTDVVVKVGMEEKVGMLAARVLEAAKLSGSNRIRIAYLGKILCETESLAVQGYSEGHVVNALVFGSG